MGAGAARRQCREHDKQPDSGGGNTSRHHYACLKKGVQQPADNSTNGSLGLVQTLLDRLEDAFVKDRRADRISPASRRKHLAVN
jgi:hypothetical protein